MTIDAVCGLMFDHDRKNLVLVRKKRPAWQAGKLNAIGGKVEPGEDPLEAMVREFREETGVDTSGDDWDFFALLEDMAHGYRVSFYRASGDLSAVETTTDETIEQWPVDSFHMGDPIRNLLWIIPAALDDDICRIDIHERHHP